MIIDFHNHYYPPEYLAAVKTGPDESPAWTTTRKATRACIIPATTTSSCRAIAISTTAKAC